MIIYISKILKDKNIIHNDINSLNCTIKNNKIYIIDFEHSIINNNRRFRTKGIFCPTFPNINQNTFSTYLKNNKCLDYK